MNAEMMMLEHESAVWRLPPKRALRLPVVPRARWLQVQDGEVWLTLAGTPDDPPSDCWLRPGALLLLPAGADAVLEGHPKASFRLLEPTSAPALSAGVTVHPARVSAWRSWLARWSLLPAAAARADPC